ncbi:MAG: MFS transporter [Clostridia bacterium]|nr:MFS transporter [Clostridia bacterium]
MAKEKLSKLNWITICLFSFIGGVAWNVENMYFNTFMYNSVYAGTSQAVQAGVMAPTTAISRMVALSAIAAVLTTFVMGTLSDKLKNRKTFIAVGYIFWGIITALFGFITKENIAALFHLSDDVKILASTVWAVIIMDIIMTIMGSMSNDAAFNAWVTDITTPKVRPLLETVLTIITFVSSGAVMGVGSFAQSGAVSYTAFFIIVGVVVTICGIAGLFLIKEPKVRAQKTAASTSYWADLFYGFRISSIKANSRLYLTFLCIGFSSIAFQVFFPYLLVYLQYVIIPENGGKNILSPSVIITAAIVAVVVLAGVIALIKLAAKNKALCVVCAGILSTVGLLVVSTSTDIRVLLIGIAPAVLGYLILTIQFNASIKDFIPKGKAGLFQGVRMIFVVMLPMVVGPFLGDLACRNSNITYTNEYGISTVVPSKSMFLYAAIVSLLVFIPLIFLIKKGFQVEEVKEDEVND